MKSVPASMLAILALTLAACGAREGAATDAPPTLTPTGGPTADAVIETVEGTAEAASPFEERADERADMVNGQIRARGMLDAATIDAMLAVPRHAFVPEAFQAQAYADHPLPIGYGQTISQPYVVARMTAVLGLEPDMRVLEIGTGSGYQAAVLAEIVDEVYTVEIIGPLAAAAAERLAALGYDNVEVLQADGYYGWQEHAPYDAIIVTAAPDHVPQPLILQMADDSNMVIPIGPVGAYQWLTLFSKVNGELQPSSRLDPVSFVPLTREAQ